MTKYELKTLSLTTNKEIFLRSLQPIKGEAIQFKSNHSIAHY